MASESAGEPELWSPLSLPAGVGSHAVWGGAEERAECGSGSGGRNVSSLFVSVCGA